MTKGLARYQQSGELHFVTFSCYHRMPHLQGAYARDCFEQCLESMRVRYAFSVMAYVVMPEHVHLLMSEPHIGSLATAIQALKLSAATRLVERRFWQKRYYDFNVFSEKKMVEKRRYIHRNPVSRGLVAEPIEWRWSSFRHWMTGERGVVEIESPWTARRETSPDEATGIPVLPRLKNETWGTRR